MLFLKRRGFEKEYIDKEKYIGYKSLWIREVIFWGKNWITYNKYG